MRKTNLLVTCYLLLVTCLLSAAPEFKILSFRETPMDMAAKIDKVKDINGETCALIKVQTDLKGVQFDSRFIEKYLDKGNGEYWVYIQPGTRRFKIRKEGIMPKDFDFDQKLKSSTVYQLKLSSVGDTKKIENIAVNIITTPQRATIYLDGENRGTKKKVMTSIGKHQLKIVKDGYQTINKEIEVTAKNTLFEFKLKEIEDAMVMITTEPAGAEVVLDGVSLGNSPISTFYPSGSYKLKLSKDMYETEEFTLNITGTEVNKTYTLKPAWAELTIKTHEKATVYLNGNQIYNLTNIKLKPMITNIKVTMNKAKDLEERVILKKNDRKTIELYPKISTGKVQIAVIPADAEIEFSEPYGESYSSTGAKSFKDVPVGTYNLKVSKKGYKTIKEEFTLRADKTIRKSIKLEEGADVGGDFIFVKGGTFQMGSNEESDEKPIHSVTVDDFYIGKYEVTQKEWKEIMGSNPSYFKGDNLPVEQVSWDDIQEFLRKLNAKTGGNYRLPTEAEWEYAARGGASSRGYKYAGSNDIDEVAWYSSNSGSKTHQVGTKQPNELGIYDMSGNVWEWCSDWYDSSYYSSSPSRNPKGPSSERYRVLRGGSWSSLQSYTRVAVRLSNSPGYRGSNYGFRVARTN